MGSTIFEISFEGAGLTFLIWDIKNLFENLKAFEQPDGWIWCNNTVYLNKGAQMSPNNSGTNGGISIYFLFTTLYKAVFLRSK